MKTGSVIAFLVSVMFITACAPDRKASPTGLKAGMTRAQVIEIMGPPSSAKQAGTNKEILIFRKPPEMINVFIVDGRIKSIEHIRQRPMIAR